jgi:hypothetical protein
MQGPPTTPTEDDEASIPTENLRTGPNLNRTFTVRRKAVKRTFPWYLPTYEIQLASPRPQDEDTRETKRPRFEEPVPTSTDEAAAKTISDDTTVALTSCDAAPAAADNADSDPVMDMHPEARTAGATGRWTLVEDAKLTSAVMNIRMKKLGNNYKSDWVVVATLVPGRTNAQCCNRCHDTLDPSIDRVTGRTLKWKEDEDIKLKAAVQKHGGKDWIAIAALVPGRTKTQCNTRWHDILDPGIDRTTALTGEWKEDEDIKLKAAAATHGGKNWVAIATLVAGRTKQKCYDRWKKNMDPNRSTVRGKQHCTFNKAPALGQDPQPN